MKVLARLGVVGACLFLDRDAGAFSGFYVSGADAKLRNDAAQVVLMRDGTRTVVSLQNTYKGPPENFAMVVPVPVVLQKANVKTLDRALFAKLDRLSAPRLVEYWEQDPCAPIPPDDSIAVAAEARTRSSKTRPDRTQRGVKIEAQFVVGEYDVVVLSAQDAESLESWLRRQKYKIPDGVEPYLRSYIQNGSKFFVARVDAKKVQLDSDGRADLSPLRFQYDASELSLPVRLGLVNSGGTQDLIIHVLARGQRYEPANYPSVTVPTNIDVTTKAKDRFGEFYAALFDRTLEKQSKAIVTEYSWDASTCDPCTGPPLDARDIASLGADVLATGERRARGRATRERAGSGWVVTRLHTRYAKDALGPDIVFKAAPPITGGREIVGANGELEHGSTSSPTNSFQGRYVVRHSWTGPMACNEPRRGVWGGPPAGATPASREVAAATRIAFAARGAPLAQLVLRDVPELDLKASTANDSPAAPATGASLPTPRKRSGCAGCATVPAPADTTSAGGLVAFIALSLRRIRSRRAS